MSTTAITTDIPPLRIRLAYGLAAGLDSGAGVHAGSIGIPVLSTCVALTGIRVGITRVTRTAMYILRVAMRRHRAATM